MTARVRYSIAGAILLTLLLASSWVAGTRLPSEPPIKGDVWFRVTNVIDGDTIHIDAGAEEYRVRLLGIDAPEVNYDTGEHQCYGVEATRKVKEYVRNSQVRLVLDESQGYYDQYDRLLAYVHTREGVHLNEVLIEEGYATEFTYRRAYQHQEQYKQAQEEAQNAGRGLWSACS